jgi:hypothetical protein
VSWLAVELESPLSATGVRLCQLGVELEDAPCSTPVPVWSSSAMEPAISGQVSVTVITSLVLLRWYYAEVSVMDAAGHVAVARSAAMLHSGTPPLPGVTLVPRGALGNFATLHLALSPWREDVTNLTRLAFAVRGHAGSFNSSWVDSRWVDLPLSSLTVTERCGDSFTPLEWQVAVADVLSVDDRTHLEHQWELAQAEARADPSAHFDFVVRGTNAAGVSMEQLQSALSGLQLDVAGARALPHAALCSELADFVTCPPVGSDEVTQAAAAANNGTGLMFLVGNLSRAGSPLMPALAANTFIGVALAYGFLPPDCNTTEIVTMTLSVGTSAGASDVFQAGVSQEMGSGVVQLPAAALVREHGQLYARMTVLSTSGSERTFTTAVPLRPGRPRWTTPRRCATGGPSACKLPRRETCWPRHCPMQRRSHPARAPCPGSVWASTLAAAPRWPPCQPVPA